LSAPVLKNLQKLTIEIDGILNGEDNVKVFLYTSELPEAICLQMGEGKQELPILLDEDGIQHRGTVHHGKTTFWEKIMSSITNFFRKCFEVVCSLASEIMLSICRSVVPSFSKLVAQKFLFNYF
jgi:hypothetical protein